MIQRDTDIGPAVKIVEYTYDYLNRWVTRSVDSDGDGPLGFQNTYFVYDGTPGPSSLSPWETGGVRAVGSGDSGDTNRY